MFICIFLTWALCLLLDWYQCTWLDDDGPAASLLPRFTVTSGAQPAFSVSLHYDHPGYHLPQQQVQLLHMVVPQKNLPGCLAQVRTSQYLSLDPCTVTYREVDSLDCFQHMILVHVIVIIGKLYNINTDFFIVSFFFWCHDDVTFVVPSAQSSNLARSSMATAFSLLVSGIWWARNAR